MAMSCSLLASHPQCAPLALVPCASTCVTFSAPEPSLLPVTARPVCPQSVVLRCDVARESQTVGRFLSFESPLFFGKCRNPLSNLSVGATEFTVAGEGTEAQEGSNLCRSQSFW